jgi:hypothetical protein
VCSFGAGRVRARSRWLEKHRIGEGFMKPRIAEPGGVGVIEQARRHFLSGKVLIQHRISIRKRA